MSTETPPTLQEDDDDVQARLMRMLDAVRLEKPADVVVDESFPAAAACSNCGSQEPWGAASWCPDCGYYPKLGRAITPVEAAAEAKIELRDLAWLPVLIVGTIILISGSIAIRCLVADPITRSHWAVGQILVGFTLLCIAQVQAYLVAAQLDHSVSLGSLFHEPSKLWMPVFLSLPKSQRTLQLGVWSATAMLLAVLVVGVDLGTVMGGMAKKQKPVNPVKTIMKVAGAASNGKNALSASEEEMEDNQLSAGEGGGGSNGPEAASTENAINSFANDSGANELAAAAGNGGAGKSRSLKSAGEGVAANGETGENANNGLPAEAEAAVAQKGEGEGAAQGDAEAKAAGKLAMQDPAKPKPVTPEAAPPVDPPIPPNAKGEERKDRSEFIVFGYLTNPAGELRSVLLADIRNDRLRFVSKMPVDDISAEKRQQLQVLLDQYRVKSPILETPYRARWVQPVVKVRVGHVGRTPAGEIRDAYLIRFDDLSQIASR